MNVFIFYYLIFINMIGFILMYLDKSKARRSQLRIKESTLLTVSILGGSVGSYIGMEIFRHKTKHGKFKYGIPFIILVQISLFILSR